MHSLAGLSPRQHVDIISGEIRSIAEGNQSQKGYGLIYTNQTLPGSSGGAVLDEKGNLIAINGLTKRDRKTGRDISRGIPINLFLAAKDSLKVNQEAIRVTIPLNTTITGFFNPNLSILGQVNSGQYQLAYTTNALHSSSVYSLAVSGDKIVSGSLDKTIKVWNLNTGQLERTLEGHSGSVNSVAVSGNKIVSGQGNTIKVWRLQ